MDIAVAPRVFRKEAAIAGFVAMVVLTVSLPMPTSRLEARTNEAKQTVAKAQTTKLIALKR